MNIRKFLDDVSCLWGASDQRIFLAIFLVVSVFRILTIALLFSGDPLANGGDAVQYHFFGLSIAQDPGWFSKHLGVVPPLYPFFLAGVYKIVGDCPMCALYAQTLLAGLTAGLIFLIGKRVFGTWVGVLSAFFFMVHPSAVTWGGVLIRETLIMFLFTGTLMAALEIRHGSTSRRVILLGVAYGLLILTDTRFLFYAPFLALYLFVPRGGQGWGWNPTFLFGAVIILMLVPWTVRNFIAYDKFVLIDTRTLSFIKGKGADHPDYIKPPQEVSALARRHMNVPAAGGAEATSKAGPTGPSSLNHHLPDPRPTLFDKVLYNFQEFWRICRFHESNFPVFRPHWSRSHNWGSILYFIPLLILTVVGGGLYYRRDRMATVVLIFPLLGHTLLHMFAPYSNTRYRMPIEIPMILLAMYALVWLLEWLSKKLGSGAAS